MKRQDLKSIGNSVTYREDIYNYEDIKRLLYVLSESVASRLNDFGAWARQTPCICGCAIKSWKTILFRKKCAPRRCAARSREAAFALFCKSQYKALRRAVRGLGVTVSGFDKGVRTD